MLAKKNVHAIRTTDDTIKHPMVEKNGDSAGCDYAVLLSIARYEYCLFPSFLFQYSVKEEKRSS